MKWRILRHTENCFTIQMKGWFFWYDIGEDDVIDIHNVVIPYRYANLTEAKLALTALKAEYCKLNTKPKVVYFE